MAFTDQEIRAIVETGHYSDPRAVDYITKILVERRDKIGRTYYAKVLPLDRFEVRENRLIFRDLAVDAGFVPARQFEISWSRFDNASNTHSALSAAGPSLPAEALSSPAGSYFAARINATGVPQKTVTVYIRAAGSGPQVVGIDRKW